MSDEYTAGLFLLLGVVAAALFSNLTTSRAWLRQQRLDAYQRLELAIASLLTNPAFPEEAKKEYDSALANFRLTATWFQHREANWVDRYITEGQTDIDEWPDYESKSNALFLATQRALGVKSKVPMVTRASEYMLEGQTRPARVLYRLVEASTFLALGITITLLATLVVRVIGAFLF